MNKYVKPAIKVKKIKSNFYQYDRFFDSFSSLIPNTYATFSCVPLPPDCGTAGLKDKKYIKQGQFKSKIK